MTAPVHLYCDDRGLFLVEDKVFSRFKKWRIQRSHPVKEDGDLRTLDHFFIDCGGSIHVPEPEVSVEISGTKFGCYTRHLPFIIEALQSKVPGKHIPRCVAFRGPWHLYIISHPTCVRLIAALEKLYEESKLEIATLEYDHHEALGKAGVIDLGKCSCQSKKLYKECCGRAAPE